MESELNVYEISSESITYATDSFVKFKSGMTLHYDAEIKTQCANICYQIEETKNNIVTFYHLDTVIYAIKVNNVLHLSNGVAKKENSLILSHPIWYQ
jgi:hypothetical protein